MAVSRAIARGRLNKSITRDDKGRPWVTDVALADLEWAQNTDYTKAPTYVKEREAARAEALSAPALTVAEPDDATPEVEELEPATISDATARLKSAQADLAELKFKEAAKELVPASVVESRMSNVFAQCRTRLLALPSRARQTLPHLTASDLIALEAIVREALESLAENK